MFFTDEDMSAAETGGGTPDPAVSQDQARQAQTLDEISRRLRQMLVLAELSVSDLDLDRQLLQKALEQLRDEVNRLADSI